MSRHVLILAALTVMLLPGCVHRRLTVNSSPTGALVRIDGEDIGYTPASVDFTWYGEREVQVIKDGYETQTRLVNLQAPWYQKFPFDFFSDNFLGTHIRDQHRFQIRMQPKQQGDAEGVIERGRSLRGEAMHGL